MGWNIQLRELSDENVWASTDDTEKERERKGKKNAPGMKGKDGQKKAQALGEGHKTLLWIWKLNRVRDDRDDTGVQEGQPAYDMLSAYVC